MNIKEVETELSQNDYDEVRKFFSDAGLVNNNHIKIFNDKSVAINMPLGRLRISGRQLSFNNLTHIPYKIRTFSGNLDILRHQGITSLINLPKTFDGSLNINGCKNLNSLEGCPDTVRDIFDITYTDLKSLEGGPTTARIYYCGPNIKSLKGAPKVVGANFVCRNPINLPAWETRYLLFSNIGGFDFGGETDYHIRLTNLFNEWNEFDIEERHDHMTDYLEKLRDLDRLR